jgi:hypothetical protein
MTLLLDVVAATLSEQRLRYRYDNDPPGVTGISGQILRGLSTRYAHIARWRQSTRARAMVVYMRHVGSSAQIFYGAYLLSVFNAFRKDVTALTIHSRLNRGCRCGRNACPDVAVLAQV